MGKIDLNLAEASEADLVKAERAVARKHIGKFPWFSVVWAFVNFAVWLVMLGYMPLWAGFLIACAKLALCYLPSHEAQHDIIAMPGTKLRWLNEFVGHMSLIPLVLPFSTARLTHLEHHKHANDPKRDPDYSTHAKNGWHAIWKSLLNRQPRAPGGVNAYGATLMEMHTPQAKRALILSLFYLIGFYGFLSAMAWSGYALRAALLWWLPRHVGLTYIQYFLSWAPHHPGETTGRYRDTRAWRSRLGNVLTMGMQYHIIHHLHPRIPLVRTPAAYWEMKPVLEARGCQIDGL